MRRFRDWVFLLVVLILALWLSPFILGGGVIYLLYRLRRGMLRKKLCERIALEWFPQGKHVFFLYSDSHKWKAHFEEKLIPRLGAKAVVWNWSSRHQHGWNDSLESEILRLYRPDGNFYPVAIVFLATGEVKVFALYEPYMAMLKSGAKEYSRLEEELVGVVEGA